MAIARAYAATHIGLTAHLVTIEVVARETDTPFLVIVGLPDATVREAKDRVSSALRETYVNLGNLGITVNLAPADIKKEGAHFDLPIALAILAALNKIPKEALESYLIIGELGLDGTTKPVVGALAAAAIAKEKGKALLLPDANKEEACLITGLTVLPATNLSQASSFLNGAKTIHPHTIKQNLHASITHPVDFSDVKGQPLAKRALEIAAAGGHNVLFSGPPGTGKSMLAKAFQSILPLMTYEEAIESAKIYSIAGKFRERQLPTQRPFRAPHHTASYAGMIGGGTNPRPGEVALAHGGVLFLDELPEFSRQVLEALREPLEEKTITISRAQNACTFPANFIFLGAMNPCPCGFLGHSEKQCIDTKKEVDRYVKKISGPLLDRIDINIHVGDSKLRVLNQLPPSESSNEVQKRVTEARRRQYARFGCSKVNASMSNRDLAKFFPLEDALRQLLEESVDSLQLSIRSYHRIHRVAATIADLAASDVIQEEHLLEAMSLRTRS